MLIRKVKYYYSTIGGPRFEMLSEVQTNPSVVRQHVWEDSAITSSLPYLPFQSSASSSSVSKPHHTVAYGRHSGLHGHNKTVDPVVRFVFILLLWGFCHRKKVFEMLLPLKSYAK